jgi:protein SCO1/2
MINSAKALVCFLILITTFWSCTQQFGNDKLPIMGRQKIVQKEVAGKMVFDTLDHTVAKFSFVNQDSVWITNTSFKNKIYVADFFFTSCPTICPKMKKQMLRVYDKYENIDQLMILSHTIDPTHDNVAVLKDFSDALGVSSDKWHFVTGDEDTIYELGEKSYMVTTGEDATAAGGYIHSGAFLLVDNLGRIRGVYDGTEEDQVTMLLNDIDLLLKELNDEQ